MLGYKTRQSKNSYRPSSGLTQLARSLPSLDHSESTSSTRRKDKPAKTGSQGTPRKKTTAIKRYIPREDSLELSDVFLDPKGKSIHGEDSNRSMSTEGTSADSWHGSAETFSTTSPSSLSVGRWVGSNDSIEDATSSPTDESEHSKTSSMSSNSSGNATTCASNLSDIIKARRKVASKSKTTCTVDEFFEIWQAPIASDIDELDLMEYMGSSTTSTSRAKSTLQSTLAMHSKTNEAAVRLTKDINAFIDTVQAVGANKKMGGSSRCLSDTNLVSQYQMKQQEIERLHRVTAERKREAVRYKKMADDRSSSMPGRPSPKPAKTTSRRGSTGAIVLAKDEAMKRRSQLVRSGRGTKDLPSMVSYQSTGGILKQKHQRRYSTGGSSISGSGLDVSSASDSFHDSSTTFLSQDSTTSSRSTSNFSVKFKKPTIITYEKEQDYRTPYDSDGRRRRPSKPCTTACATDLNDAIQNEVVARRLASATPGRRSAGRRNSMPAGHMGESLPTSTMLPPTKPTDMPRRSATDMISSMEQRLRRLSNESSDEESPLRNRPMYSEGSATDTLLPAPTCSDQVSLNYSNNVSRRLSGDAVNSFYQCPEDNALDATMRGVGERGAAATFSFPEGPRSSPGSSPRSHRVVTRPPSRMEMAMKAMGFGKGR